MRSPSASTSSSARVRGRRWLESDGVHRPSGKPHLGRIDSAPRLRRRCLCCTTTYNIWQARQPSADPVRAQPHRRPCCPIPLNRLLLTGAAGGLGRELRPRLKRLLRDAARVRHRRPRRRRARARRSCAAALEDRAADAGAARGRRRRRAPGRRLDRAAVGADPRRPTSSASTTCTRRRASTASSASCSRAPTT